MFYTGFTKDIERRISEHKKKVNKGFTQRYNVDQLLYYEEYSSAGEAINREKELKKFRREWKLQLIRRMNPGLRDLSEGW